MLEREGFVMKSFKDCLAWIAIFLLANFSLGCGGGGGSDNSGNPANVYLDVYPSTIDSGDRINVNVRIEDAYSIDNDGVLLKIRYSSSLTYITNSAVYFGDGKATGEDLVPYIAYSDETTYLIITIRPPGDTSADGVISFQLEGKYAVSNGLIEVDVDREVKRSSQVDFSVSNPQFTPLVQTKVNVVEG